MPEPIATLIASAKLTLSLRITGVREDGYHLIEAEMVSLDLADRLVLRDGDGIDVVDVSDIIKEPAAEVDQPVPANADNLVARALALVDRRAHVQLEKAIPAGAGLGGGSSDAAAVLRWAGFDDLLAAARLGADVPFCLVGGRARVTGIGEVVEPLPFERRTFTLLTPPFGCSTPAVYAAWDRLGGPRAVAPDSNDLEAAAVLVEPRLVSWRDQLADLSGSTPRLAGSGSTWFVEGAFSGEGTRVVHTAPPIEWADA